MSVIWFNAEGRLRGLRRTVVTGFGSKSTHQPLKCAQFRLGRDRCLVLVGAWAYGRSLPPPSGSVRLTPYRPAMVRVQRETATVHARPQELRRSRPHSHCGSIRFRTFYFLDEVMIFNKIQPFLKVVWLQNRLPTSSITIKQTFLKLAYFSTLPIFIWQNSVLFSTVLICSKDSL
jgi:hypothetical protein